MIKNIIFDVGGVLLGYRWKEMFIDYGMTSEEADEFAKIIFDDELWAEFDLANLRTEEVIEKYVEKYPGYEDKIRWFRSHGELMPIKREKVWEKVHMLKEKGYGIYILSNYAKDLFDLHTKGASFLEDADGMVVSYQIHVIKPDIRIYKYILDKYGLKADECLFFDDLERNVLGAKRAGIKATVVTSEEMLKGELDKLLSI